MAHVTLSTTLAPETPLQSSAPKSVKLVLGKPPQRLTDVMMRHVAQTLSELSLRERQVKIEGLPIDLTEKLHALTSTEISLREATDIEAVIAIFKDIKGFCHSEKDPRDYFTFYFKPMIEKIAAEKPESMAYQKFVSQANTLHPEIAEMLGLRYCCQLRSSGNLKAFCQNRNYITKLSINYPIGAAGAKALANALKVNKTLTNLDLKHNNIGAAGAKALADALKGNNTIISLNLRNNGIGDDGAAALADALRVNQTLTSLNLRNNFIGNADATALAHALKGNQTLTTLNLGNNFIEADGATALVNALKENKTLTSLNLKNNYIKNAGVTALADALKDNKTLIRLDLYGNGIGDVGATALADALKVNQTLTSLNLSWSGIGDAGAAALARALEGNQTLTSLNLSRYNIGAAGAEALQALKARFPERTIVF